MILKCIWALFDLNHDCGMGYTDEVFCGFPQLFQVNNILKNLKISHDHALFSPQVYCCQYTENTVVCMTDGA
jgi:hypothetical protein